MTALVCEKKMIHDKKGQFPHEGNEALKDELWEYLETMKSYGSLMGCSRTGATEKTFQIDGEDSGVMSGHAYSLNDVFAIHNSNNSKREHSRLLRVRNPWGRGEWKLKWSDFSDEITENKKALQERID
jgi:hypothetical protein